MSSVSDRLRVEVERSFDSWRSFQRALPAGIKGSSYKAVHNYLSGKRTPPLDFLKAAGRVLGVRPEWLRDGTGEKTVTNAAVEAARARREYLNATLSAHVLAEVDGLDDVVVALILRLGARWGELVDLEQTEGLSEEDLVAISGLAAEEFRTAVGGDDVSRGGARLLVGVRQVKELLYRPLAALGIPSERMDTDYAVAMLHALSLAMPKP